MSLKPELASTGHGCLGAVSRWFKGPTRRGGLTVRLEGQDAGHIGVGGCRCQEDAEVSDSYVVGEAQETKANDAHESVDDDEWPSDVVLVTYDIMLA